ncbi:hypothetical protein Tco_0659899 [Tanacetum coccineum]
MVRVGEEVITRKKDCSKSGASQPTSSQKGQDVSDNEKGVTPTVVDMGVEMEKLSSLEDTIVLGSFPPLPTQVTTSADNAPGKSSYANVIGKPSEKKLNIHTLFTPGGNGIDVVVPVESIRAISERFANTAYGFLGSGLHTLLLLTMLESVCVLCM